MKFYASQRLDIRRVETLKDGDEKVGNRVRVKVVAGAQMPAAHTIGDALELD